MTEPDDQRQDADISEIRRDLVALRGEIALLRQESVERENSRLRWGIGALGAVIMVVATWVWSEIKHLFDLTIGNP